MFSRISTKAHEISEHHVIEEEEKKIYGDDSVKDTKMWNCIPCLRQRTLKMMPWLSERPHIGNIWEYPPTRGDLIPPDKILGLWHHWLPNSKSDRKLETGMDPEVLSRETRRVKGTSQSVVSACSYNSDFAQPCSFYSTLATTIGQELIFDFHWGRGG